MLMCKATKNADDFLRYRCFFFYFMRYYAILLFAADNAPSCTEKESDGFPFCYVRRSEKKSGSGSLV